MLACNTTQTSISFVYYDDNLLKSQEEWTNAYGDNTHHTLSYTYDADGNRASVSLPGVIAFNYAYTARNQPYTLTQTGNNFVYATYGYDPNGNMTSRQLYNGIRSTLAYDAVNRVTDITHPFTSGSKTFHYEYDPVGNRATTVRNGGTPDNFDYDLNNQLTSFQPGGGTLSSFTLDANGNRTSMNAGGVNTVYTPNILNQYTTVSYKGSATYDGNGNLKTYDGWTYTYDAMNRLTTASDGTTTANFYYDGLNRQVARGITGQHATFSVWDGGDMYSEYYGGNVWNRNTIHGAPGDLITQRSGTSVTYFYRDGLGSTSSLPMAMASLVEQYTYDAFGRPTVYNGSGTVLPSGSAYGSDHLFTGRQWHPSLGLYDNRARFLHPDLGRFLQPDPIGFAGDPSNLSRYCGNNPANWSDPSGLFSLSGLWGKLVKIFTEDKNGGNPNTGIYRGYDVPGTGGPDAPDWVDTDPNDDNPDHYTTRAPDRDYSYNNGSSFGGNGLGLSSGDTSGGFDSPGETEFQPRTSSIDPHVLAMAGQHLDGPGMRQFATVVNTAAWVPAAAVALPVAVAAAPMAWQATLLAAQGITTGVPVAASAVVSQAQPIVAYIYLGVVIPTSTLTITNPRVHELLEEAYEESWKWR